MTDYLSQSIFQPSIPTHLITDEDRRFFEAFSISIDPDGDEVAQCALDAWVAAGHAEPARLDSLRRLLAVRDSPDPD